MGLLTELRRRKVTRVAAVYVVTAWVLLQIVDVVGDPLHLPEWFATTIAVTLIIGFPLAVVLAWAFELTPEGMRRTSSQGEGAVVAPGQSRIDYALMALLVATIGWMFYTSGGSDSQPVEAVAPDAPAQAQTQAPAPAPAPAKTEVLHNSIAVLPFENLSPDPDNAYFAAGIHEEILNQLSKINDLSVIARTSVMQYAGVHRPIAEIARELNVNAVMEGSVRYAGNRVRITAQLIDAASGAHLWSEAFEDDLADIFGIQLAIANKIADALQAEFSPAERQRVGSRTTNNPQAYAHYLRAVASYGSFRPTQPVHEALDAALALDPDFDTALAFKAFTHAAEGYTFDVFGSSSWDATTVRRSFALADEYARRALALDSKQSRAHQALSIVHQGRWEWQAALESAERAYALNPNDYLIAAWMGRLRALAGNEEDGIALFRRALQLNPNDMVAVSTFGNLLQDAGRWQESVDQFRIVAAVVPDAVLAQGPLADSSFFAGDLETTRRIAAMLESGKHGALGLLWSAYLYGLLGDVDKARHVLDRAVAHPEYATLPSSIKNGLAFNLHIAVQDIDLAINDLERIVDDHLPLGVMETVFFHPDNEWLGAIRSRPEFAELVRRVTTPDPTFNQTGI